MWTRTSRSFGLILGSWILATGGAPAVDRDTAVRYFQEARTLSDQDGGRLWGPSLYGPMLFVDGASRAVVTNGPDTKGALHRQGEAWEGSLPATVGVANTTLEWSGTRWTMVMWPLPEDRHTRDILMMHECFHRIQGGLGLGIQDRPCGHLDAKEGRIWLQLEWRALAEALVAHGPGRHRAIQDALLFRAYRRSLFPTAAGAELNMELKEGLAEYTGIRSSARSEAQAITDALVDLYRYAHMPTFVRSFAYASGPGEGTPRPGGASSKGNGHPNPRAGERPGAGARQPLWLVRTERG